MTKQQMFNKVVAHLEKQRVQSVDRNGDCRYRYRGKKCAIGCLIPDSKYLREFEGTSISGYDVSARRDLDHLIRLIRKAAGITWKLLPLARALQTAHDGNPAHWPIKLRMLRERYRLSQPRCLTQWLKEAA